MTDRPTEAELDASQKVILDLLHASQKAERQEIRRANIARFMRELRDGTVLRDLGVIALATLIGCTLSYCGLSGGARLMDSYCLASSCD